MATWESCVETVLSGENVFLLDAKELTWKTTDSSGPLAIWSLEEYARRYGAVRAAGNEADPVNMFASSDQCSTLSGGELNAYLDYLQHSSNVLAPENLQDGYSVVAYEAERNRSYAPERRTGALALEASL